MTDLREAAQRVLQFVSATRAQGTEYAGSTSIRLADLESLALAANPPSPTPPAGAAEVRAALDAEIQAAFVAGCVDMARYAGLPTDDFGEAAGDYLSSRTDALAILTSLSAPVPDDGWRPIEEAPRDGTWIWAADQGRQRGPWVYYTCWWDEDEGYWVDHADSEPEPTRWRPLPPPPGQGEKP